MTLAIDYAWTHPDPAAIKRAGYSGVLRYFSHDSSKDITLAEVRRLHAAGLWVAVVFETTAARATAGKAAGIADRKEAEHRAGKLGYPRACPIFYAVDQDVRATQVEPYFHGIREGNLWHAGVYGGVHVVDAIQGAIVGYGWQTAAWSGANISREAHLYQRAKHTRPLAGGGFDENAVLRPFPVWQPAGVKPPAPKPAPAPHPSPAPAPKPSPGPDHDLLVAVEKWKQARGLT